MRTRFLNIDYFSPSPTSSSSSSQTTGLLNLPVPHLSSLNFSLSETHALLFDYLQPIDISQEIDGLRIDIVLSKLLEDVIPHIIDLEDGGYFESAVSSSQVGSDDRNIQEEVGEKEATETSWNIELADHFTKIKSAEDVGVQNGIKKMELVQFEIPEIKLHLEDSCISDIELMSIFSEVPQTENTLDINSQEPGNLYKEAEESVYFIGDLNLENLLEPIADVVEDDDTGHGLLQSKFRLLEVDDINLGTPVKISAEDELMMLLDQAGPKDLTQMVDMSILNCGNVLHRMEYDLLEHPSHTCSSFLEAVTSMELLMELDFISIGGTLYVPANSACQGITAENGLLTLNSVVLEELQILDEDPAPHLEVFNYGHFQELELCREMAQDDLNCKSFDELIVSHELALVDDIFKSMPIPVLWDYDMINDELARDFIIDLKPQAASASDGIYLDWHILEEEQYSSRLCSFYQDILEGVDLQDSGFDLTVGIEKVILDLIFSDNSFDGTNIEENSESADMLFSGLDMLNPHIGGAVTCDFPDEHEEQVCGVLNSEDTSERPSLLFNSVSPFNDLEFFLNPSKGRPDVTQVIVGKTPVETIQRGHSKASICMDNQLQQKNVVLYEVHLSHEILAVIDILKTSYLDILERNPVLKGIHKSFDLKDTANLLKISKPVFFDIIKNLSVQRPRMGNGDEIIMSVAALCAIKQMTWYMCFYGTHTARSYFNRLCESLSSFRARLNALHGSFPDTDMPNVSSHPSLAVIRDILLSSTPNISSKTLVLADKVYWSALKNLLISMGLSFHDVNESNSVKHVSYTSDIVNILVGKDCLLASPESISPDFPFDKFKMILEYGGYCGSSRMPPLPPTLNCRPCLHFLKMELDNLSAAGALCDGVTMPQKLVSKVDEKFHLAKDTDDSIDFWVLERLLNFLPIENDMETKYREESSGTPKDLNEPFVAYTVHIRSRMTSFPESVIVVNTQNSGKEMIVSRRSTYQKILACEGEGIQVIERDSNLPVDIIISPAVCLLWYECSNIAKEKTTPDEDSSWLSSYIENIAANILSVLSFSFSSCILIFEGGADFLATVMESSNGLCAAAASLEIDLQFFCSYSPELTDEIILRCIATGTDSVRGLFPNLPELETLGESFLCKFPSINPLTAQAILSNGGMLVNFLEWSLESRISAVQRYQVSDESISLFSFLCRYGEREDSHSIMTDSSSVSYSSAHDSKNYPDKLDAEKKRYKYTRNPQNFDTSADDLIQHETSIPAANNIQFPLFSSSDSVISKDLDLFNDARKIDFSFKDFVGQDGFDAPISMDPSKVAYPNDFQMPKHNQFAEAFDRKSNLGTRNSGKHTVDNLEWASIMNSEPMHDEVGQEVIDVTDSKGANLMEFPFSFGDEREYPVKKPRMAREFSSGRSDHPVFPSAAEIDYGSYMKIPVNHQKQSVLEGNEYFSRKPHENQMLMRNQNNMVNEDIDWRSSSGISENVSIQEERSNYRGTPLKNAIHSSTLQKGSPWSIELLNRIREKNRSRQQLQPSGASPSPNVRRNRSNSIKRRSPSIIEFFKYQGSSSCSKIPELKNQKTSSQSSGHLKNKKALEPLDPSSTPPDKRARRTLSFTTNKKGGQSKLIWNDKFTT